jgi:hypothetical protein
VGRPSFVAIGDVMIDIPHAGTTVAAGVPQ